jgi:hypothetical protein
MPPNDDTISDLDLLLDIAIDQTSVKSFCLSAQNLDIASVAHQCSKQKVGTSSSDAKRVMQQAIDIQNAGALSGIQSGRCY